MSRGAARGPPFGMGLDVESSRPGLWFPLGFGSSFGFRVSDGPVGVNIVQVFCFGQGVRVIFGGHGLMQQRRMVSFRGGQGGSRTATTGEGSPGSAGGVRLQEGWIPASAGKTDGGWQCGAAPARPFDPPQRTYSRHRVSGPSLDSGSRAGMMGDVVGLGIK